MHISNIPTVVNVASISTVTVAAFWRGGRREQLMAVLMGASMVSGQFHFAMNPWIETSKDVVELAVAFGCSWGARSYWPIWVSAAYLCSLVGDAVYVLDRPHISWWSYASQGWAFCYAAMAALLWGCLVYRRDEGRHAPWWRWPRNRLTTPA